MLWEQSTLAALAVCHFGPGSEADKGGVKIKFGLVRSGARAEHRLDQLISAVDALAAQKGLARVVLGVNLVHEETHRRLHALGFVANSVGVSMHRDNQPHYRTPGAGWVMDDWR